MSLPAWRRPPGVDAALWDYATSDRLALGESAFLAGDPLAEADEAFLLERFAGAIDVLDLGCGAGRLALALARTGARVAAVDLSLPMLRALGVAADREGLAIARVRADLCRLGGVPEGRFDLALMMYSTLGMIAGRPMRRRALGEAAGRLRRGGRLVVHAHNLWVNLANPSGRRWLLGELPRLLTGRPTRDRPMRYRGLSGLRVHPYRWGELRSDLRSAGLRVAEVRPLDAVTARPIGGPRWTRPLRAGGWIAVAERGTALNGRR